MKIEIKKFQNNYMANVMEVWERSARSSHSFMSEDFFKTEKINFETKYIPNTETWVSITNGQVTGFISLKDNEVEGFFVDPEFQGYGLGQKLLDKAKEIHNELELVVFKENVRATRFYKKYGFEIIGEEMVETGNMMIKMELKQKI